MAGLCTYDNDNYTPAACSSTISYTIIIIILLLLSLFTTSTCALLLLPHTCSRPTTALVVLPPFL